MSTPTTPFVLSAFPMHGQQKLATEGYRTRDGHMIEWFGRLLQGVGEVDVVSRPDPLILKRSYPSANIACNTFPVNTYVPHIPNLRNRKKWWVKSARYYPLTSIRKPDGLAIWNPFVFASPGFAKFASDAPVVFDLLDDWSVHHAFSEIVTEVNAAYGRAFDAADTVFANSEGTAELARRFGRTDVVLMPNGTDRNRFSPESNASGPLRIGYLGKIGKRIDLELVLEAAHAFPEWEFAFAGPVIDREFHAPLRAAANIRLLGDVPYREVPTLLQTFDVGWVPHSVGSGEVGGDAIKIYEYNAAGLPVLSTPIIGAGKRGLNDVYVERRERHVEFLRAFVGGVGRVARVVPSLPPETAWEYKARRIVIALTSASSLSGLH